MLAETCSFYHFLININYVYIVVLLTVITLSINYYTQRGWHISKLEIFQHSGNRIPVIKIACKPTTTVAGVSSVLKTERNNMCFKCQ